MVVKLSPCLIRSMVVYKFLRICDGYQIIVCCPNYSMDKYMATAALTVIWAQCLRILGRQSNECWGDGVFVFVCGPLDLRANLECQADIPGNAARATF